MNTSIRYRRFLSKQYPIPDQNGQNLYNCFQTKTAPKPYPLRRQVPRAIRLIKGSTPSPGEPPQLCVTLDE